MKMNFENLLNEGKLEKIKSSQIEWKRIEEDLKTADSNFNLGNFEWAMSISYHAVLRTGIYLMNYLGYRAKGKDFHKVVFEFLKECNIDINLTYFFDKIRIKRNNFIYRGIEEVSKQEVKEILNNSKLFVQKIRKFVQKIRTRRKNE
jgi:uncharacterized protein (UPF0332 family)